LAWDTEKNREEEGGNLAWDKTRKRKGLLVSRGKGKDRKKNLLGLVLPYRHASRGDKERELRVNKGKW
jgi:hypothetical protein